MNRTSTERLLVLALAASLAGCATTRTEIASTDDAAVLEGTEWRLVAAPGESTLPDVGPGAATIGCRKAARQGPGALAHRRRPAPVHTIAR